MPINVAIVEDDAHTREGLAQLINRTADFNCISRHATAEDAIERVPAFKPDVVLTDINLPGLSGWTRFAGSKRCCHKHNSSC